jgi:hypothetical protein
MELQQSLARYVLKLNGFADTDQTTHDTIRSALIMSAVRSGPQRSAAFRSGPQPSLPPYAAAIIGLLAACAPNPAPIVILSPANSKLYSPLCI